jgi:ribonuclease HI
MADRTELLAIYTDGACTNNGKADAAAGVGVYLGKDDPRNVSMPLEKVPHTNNRAELWAIKLALDIIEEEKPIKAIIHTDSQYALKSLTVWIVNWKKNGWLNAKKKPILNKDIIQPIEAQLTKMSVEDGIVVSISYVTGHSGDVDGNYHADLLATQGVLKEMPPSPKRQRTE